LIKYLLLVGSSQYRYIPESLPFLVVVRVLVKNCSIAIVVTRFKAIRVARPFTQPLRGERVWEVRW